MSKTAKMRELHALRESLRGELEKAKLGELDELAETKRKQIRKVSEKMKTLRQEHREKENERRRRNREAQERHEKAQKEQEAEMARRQEAREWFRGWIRFGGGRPQPASQVLDAAERAGHDPADLEAGVVRLKRRSDGTICLGFRGEYLRGEFLPVEQRASSASR